MDPNANLQEQLALAHEILEANNGYEVEIRAYRLAELVEALDAWLASGAFLPTRWQFNRRR